MRDSRTSKGAIAVAALVCGLGGVVHADETAANNAPATQQEVQELRAEMSKLQAANSQLQSQVNTLKGGQGDNWLNEARADQVKSLVRDVLSDADTRASFQGASMAAGHDKNGFFLASDDGKFYLNIWGQLQVRYIADNHKGGGTAAGSSSYIDQHEDGFTIRRSKVGFEGFIGDPKVEFRILLAPNRGTGAVELEDSWVRYTINDDWRVFAGQFQDVIAHEQMESSKRMMAVDRTLVTYMMFQGDDFSQGAGFEYTAGELLKLSGTVNDGLNSGLANPSPYGTGFQNTANDFNGDSTDVAFSGRADFKLMGKWENAGSPVGNAPEIESWSTTPTTLLLGAGGHYELGSSGDKQSMATTAQTGPYDDFYIVTGDAQFKWHGLGISPAVYLWHFDGAKNNSGTKGQLNNYFATLQVAYQVIPDKLEPFVQYEWIQVDRNITGDSGNTRHLNVVDIGANYFFKRHAMKITADVVWALNNVNADNTMGQGLTGAGVLSDPAGDKNQLVGRVQVQLLF